MKSLRTSSVLACFECYVPVASQHWFLPSEWDYCGWCYQCSYHVGRRVVRGGEGSRSLCHGLRRLLTPSSALTVRWSVLTCSNNNHAFASLTARPWASLISIMCNFSSEINSLIYEATNQVDRKCELTSWNLESSDINSKQQEQNELFWQTTLKLIFLLSCQVSSKSLKADWALWVVLKLWERHSLV